MTHQGEQVMRHIAIDIKYKAQLLGQDAGIGS
jgi:hypothetical protein